MKRISRWLRKQRGWRRVYAIPLQLLFALSLLSMLIPMLLVSAILVPFIYIGFAAEWLYHYLNGKYFSNPFTPMF